ncbi:hypothetical protein KC19_VG061200 [Ceratodon purpureus]|uniref:Uncharacterized protein n=1 Tax=Ceratodon purpureus TaxID=3225 RepID=A0A8T0HMG4_CERPU|nr:hypothetical protein KC19_VG061200 [Ceratodon purpureus]
MALQLLDSDALVAAPEPRAAAQPATPVAAEPATLVAAEPQKHMASQQLPAPNLHLALSPSPVHDLLSQSSHAQKALSHNPELFDLAHHRKHLELNEKFLRHY